jgi:hypothetical protein
MEKCWQGYGKMGTPNIADGNVRWYNDSGKTVWQFFKKLNTKLPHNL